MKGHSSRTQGGSYGAVTHTVGSSSTGNTMTAGGPPDEKSSRYRRWPWVPTPERAPCEKMTSAARFSPRAASTTVATRARRTPIGTGSPSTRYVIQLPQLSTDGTAARSPHDADGVAFDPACSTQYAQCRAKGGS